MKQIFVLTYNYTNKKLAQMAIACVIRCRSTHGKQLRVRDIIEMNRPGLYQQLSRGDKCRVGRAVSKLYNQGMLPHLTRGKKKGSTKETLNKARLTALYAICLQIFRHIAQKSLARHTVCLRNFYAICRKI